MTMQPYPSYKDSGIEWFPSIPEHWFTTRIVRYCEMKTGGTPNKNELSYWENGTVNWMSSGEVNKRIVYSIDNKITEYAVQNSNATMLPVHTIMMALNGQGKTKGMCAVLKVETTCNQSLVGFICDEKKLHYGGF